MHRRHEAVMRLSAVLGAPPARSLAILRDDEFEHLLGMLERAREEQAAALDRAIAEAGKYLPARSGQTLERHAAIATLARLIGADPESLGYLEHVPADEIRRLAEQTTHALIDGDRERLRRLAAAAAGVPARDAAVIAERAFGPLLAARVVPFLDASIAIRIARHLDDEFLLAIIEQLSPDVLSRFLLGALSEARMMDEQARMWLIAGVLRLGSRAGQPTRAELALRIVTADDPVFATVMAAIVEHGLWTEALVLAQALPLDEIGAAAGRGLALIPDDEIPAIFEAAASSAQWPALVRAMAGLEPSGQERTANAVTLVPGHLRRRVAAEAESLSALDDLGPIAPALR